MRMVMSVRYQARQDTHKSRYPVSLRSAAPDMQARPSSMPCYDSALPTCECLRARQGISP